MEDDTICSIILVWIISLACAIALTTVIVSSGVKKDMMAEAARRGYAETYMADGVSTPQIRWKENK
jgi:hypothetical protein